VDYDLVLLPPSVDIDAIFEALSNLRLCADEGQTLENDWSGSSQGRSTHAGKPHNHGKAHGQSSTTVHLNPSVGEIPTDLLTHHVQAIAEVLVTIEMTSSTSSDEDDSNWASADFSGLDNPRALRHFVGIRDYLLDGGDSDDGGYELTWP
jgi:hypothetical protein